ncbi:MAG: siphovirus Gp157 family protein [Hyphomonadaceae bacterium]|nr:siphovirus Gp157 family protein [Hyphomonadaceae bacterium]
MPDQSIPRASVTVRAIGFELNEAMKLRQMLGEDADPKLLLDTIEGETNLAEACVFVLEQTNEDEILIEGLKAKIDELQVRKGRMEKSVESRRGIILMAMDKAGLQTIKSPLGTMSVRPTQPKANITDEALIPAKFWKPSDPKLDRAAVAEALKAGEAVPGAALSNGGVSLSIRVK